MGVVPRFHFTFNPIGKNNFIHEDFYKVETKAYNDNEFLDLVINYTDNPYCPEDRIEFLDKMRKTNPKRYLVDGMGQWGEPTNDDPFLLNYDDNLHYSEFHFDFDEVETWISFDFNNSPCTASVYQIKEDGIYGMRSYKQNGGTRPLCQLIKQDAELMKVSKYLWSVTGDSSGKNYTSAGGNVNDYDIILEEFGIFPSQLINVHSRNKNLIYSRRLNDDFLYKVPFVLDSSMEDLRRDFMIAKEDGRGGLFKDRKNGYGMDFLDHHRYFIHAICPNGLEDVNYWSNRFKN